MKTKKACATKRRPKPLSADEVKAVSGGAAGWKEVSAQGPAQPNFLGKVVAGTVGAFSKTNYGKKVISTTATSALSSAASQLTPAKVNAMLPHGMSVGNKADWGNIK